jgi:hypothetical protein
MKLFQKKLKMSVEDRIKSYNRQTHKELLSSQDTEAVRYAEYMKSIDILNDPESWRKVSLDSDPKYREIHLLAHNTVKNGVRMINLTGVLGGAVAGYYFTNNLGPVEQAIGTTVGAIAGFNSLKYAFKKAVIFLYDHKKLKEKRQFETYKLHNSIDDLARDGTSYDSVQKDILKRTHAKDHGKDFVKGVNDLVLENRHKNKLSHECAHAYVPFIDTVFEGGYTSAGVENLRNVLVVNGYTVADPLKKVKPAMGKRFGAEAAMGAVTIGLLQFLPEDPKPRGKSVGPVDW